MAKKKKAAVNPARGFATTSIASKPKPEKKTDGDSSLEAQKDEKIPTKTPLGSRPVSIAEQKADAKELHQLSPEELEEELERNELQLLVDKNAAKVRRDATRLDSKVRADCRVLRGQAQSLPLSQWLPGELMLHVLDLVQKEASEVGHVAKPSSWSKAMSEEETVIKCWTLYEALLSLGLPQDSIKQAISELLKNPPNADAGPYLWGFRESLEFLAIELDETQLPSYMGRHQRFDSGIEGSSNQGTRSNTPLSSRPSTPIPETIITRTPGVGNTTSNVNSPPQKNATEKDINADDFDSDVEAEELMPTYLAIKERIYRQRPDLLEGGKPGGKKSKNLLPTASHISSSTPGLRKIFSLLRQIESDVLFDQREADQQWFVRRIQLARESATRTKPPGSGGSDSEIGEIRGNDEEMDSPRASEGHVSDNEELLGGMFSASLDDANTSTESPNSANGLPMQLRNFGIVSGMSPRRIFEDACRARDSRVSINFRLISPTVYHSRHAVTIAWSIDQETVSLDSIPSLAIEQSASSKGAGLASNMTVSMISVATPDSRQSEAFVATAALYYIFSSSAKEEKVYMKLPPAWRDLYLEFGEYRKKQIDSQDRDKVKTIREIVQEHGQREEEDGVVLASAFRNRNINSPRPGSSRDISPSRGSMTLNPGDLAALWNRVHNTPAYQRMLMTRMSLPMFGFREAALTAIDRNQVIILCGETGCGKSTQLPAYVLEHELSHGRECKIYCTEPRRISAISLAQRVSEELGERPGDVGTSRSLVGYAIRLESRITAQTRLVYATVGVVLRMLESARGLEDITHLVIDEVHERSIDTDFLLVILRSLMIRRPELKVVLMSATVDATRFSKYLNNAPIINVPGRTFPVQTRFLEDAIELTHFAGNTSRTRQQDELDSEHDVDIEGNSSGIPKQLQGYSIETKTALASYDEYRIDYELIINLMEHVALDPAYAGYSKATLVFLPGIQEIRELNDMVVGSSVFANNCWVIPLHSSIASEEQQLAFQIPPPGIRKVVLATNIAETGITIPDVTCVIDTGKHKEMRYDERRQLSRLIQSFISRANAKQRRGRAGRVQEGLCFHLFTKYRHDQLMAEQQTPEMLRLSLQDLIMRVKICGLGDIEQTLLQALDPPSSKNIRRAIDALMEVGALTPSEELTSLGNQLAKLPLDASLGKLCLLSSIFGCLDIGLTIAAILSSKSPFVTPFGDRQRADLARLAFAKGDSDLLTAYNAYSSWRRVSQTPNQSAFTFCRKNYLSQPNLTNIEDLKGQLLSSLTETGLIQLDKRYYVAKSRNRPSFVQVPPCSDINSANDIVTSTVIGWSFYPKLLVRDGKGWRNVANSQSVSLHPTSVNKGNQGLKYLSYYSMMQSGGSRFYNALSTTAAQELPLMLLVGDADFKIHAGVITIDGNRLRFKVGEWKSAIALKMLRARMEEIVDSRLKDPRKELSPRLKKWMEVFEKICMRDSHARQ